MCKASEDSSCTSEGHAPMQLYMMLYLVAPAHVKWSMHNALLMQCIVECCTIVDSFVLVFFWHLNDLI